MGKPTFLDVMGDDVLDDDALPPPPITDIVIEESPESPAERSSRLYGHLMKTIPSETWTEDWVRLVIAAEEEKGQAVCGARRQGETLKEDINRGKYTYEDLDEDPVLLVCKNPSGFKTDHPGEGRCVQHGGNSGRGNTKTGRFSLLSHNKLAPRVDEYFESEQLTDLRGAIGIIYAALDEALGEDQDISMERATEIANLMAKVGTLTKQHNDITASKQITIEVPEFIAWAEFFYELAIRYIDEGEGNVAGFLGEAQAFFNATVSLTLGPASAAVIPASSEAGGDSAGALGTSGGVEVVGVPRTGVEDT
jgi:hypothetical protein